MRRLLQTESLEDRNLLAADMSVSWQNATDCNDVNQDGVVSALDVLPIIRALNNDGAKLLPELAAGEPDSGVTTARMLVDANGDGWLTAADARQVMTVLDGGQGEGELVRVRLEVADADGNVVDSVTVGDEFELRAFVQDIRDEEEPTGVFGAYFDLTYDETLVSLESADDITFGENYPNGKNANIQVAGLIDEVGAFTSGAELGGDEQLMISVRMTANSEGTVTFGTDAADDLPAREVLFFGFDDAVDAADIDFGSVELTIQPELTATANADAFTIDEDSDANFEVLNNDVLPEGSALSDVIVTDNTNGTVEIAQDRQSINFTPSDNFFGEATFSYQVDTGAGVLTADVTVAVENVLDPPNATDDFFPADLPDGTPAKVQFFEDAGTSLVLSTVLLNDLNVDGDEQEITVVSDVTQPANGSAEFNLVQVIYTPDDDFFGEDTFEYTVTGSTSELTSTGTITVTISEVNDPPTGVDESLDFIGDGPFMISGVDLLSNDSAGPNNEDQTLTIIGINYSGTGTATLLADGNIEYTPAGGASVTETIEYTLQDTGTTDGVDDPQTTTATLTVNVEPPVVEVNTPPLAFNDDFTLTNDGNAQTLAVLDNDTALPDLDETLTIDAILVQPSNGVAVIGENGTSIVYTPNDGFVGEDSLEYSISDGRDGTASAVVDLIIEDVVDPDPDPDPDPIAPTANDDEFTIVSSSVQTLNVLADDEGDGLVITAVNTAETNGSVTITSDGTRILYAPPFNAPGIDSFTYTVQDTNGLTATATVNVSVPSLTAIDSFFAGSVFHDHDNDATRDPNERGIAGVTVVLSGTDRNGTEIEREARTSISGDFRFDNVVPGEYTVSQQQPPLTMDGLNSLGPAQIASDGIAFEVDHIQQRSDDFALEVSDRLISSEDNTFGERGLALGFNYMSAMSSDRGSGLFLVVDDEGLAWAEDHGGWSDVGSLDVELAGDVLNFTSSELGTGQISINDKSQVQVFGTTREFTLFRVWVSGQEVMPTAAVEAAFAT